MGLPIESLERRIYGPKTRSFVDINEFAEPSYTIYTQNNIPDNVEVEEVSDFEEYDSEEEIDEDYFGLNLQMDENVMLGHELDEYDVIHPSHDEF